MWNWLKLRGDALNAALGVKRYIIGGIVNAGIAIVGFLKEGGMTALIGVPTWAVISVLVLAMLGWWMLRRLVELEQGRKPKPRFELVRDATRPLGEPPLFQLKVRNDSLVTIRNVIANLERIEKARIGQLPARLQLGKVQADNVDLHPQQSEYINICRLMRETDSIPETKEGRMLFCFHDRETVATAPLGVYQITVRAYGDNAAPSEIEIRITGETRGLSHFTNLEILKWNGRKAIAEDFKA